MRNTALALALMSAGVSALAGESAAPPSNQTTITVGTEQLTLWPFLTENYLPDSLPGQPGRSDPVNLVFLNTDPRAVRQQLMALDNQRSGWDFLPVGAKGCVWLDGMGYEQAAFVEPEGWVGGAIQLVCATPDSPLGAEYRFHVRLFRSGAHTVGGAHFEINTPGTAEHTVLSWEMARQFVSTEMARIDPAAQQPDVKVWDSPGTFRTANGLVHAYVFSKNYPGNLQFLAALNLGVPQPPAFPDKPIPALGFAAVFAPGFEYVPAKSDITLTDSRTYQVAKTPKPLCGREDIQITGGPLTFTLRVQTNKSGKYQRTYTAGGILRVKTLATGEEQDAVIAQAHRAVLTDNHAEVRAVDSQMLLPTATAVGQAGYVFFGAGETDYWVAQQVCEMLH